MVSTEKGNAIADVLAKILKLITSINEAEHAKEEKYTQTTVENLRLQFPEYNVLIVHPKHSRNFVNEYHQHVELPLTAPRTQGYEIYCFDSGSFTLEGDGGFINWCFAGSYTRDGNNVNFNKIPSQIPPVPSPPAPTPPPPPEKPVRTHKDGIYLLNCMRGNEISSGVAYVRIGEPHSLLSRYLEIPLRYYKNLRDGGNFGSRPDDYVDVTKGSFQKWEQTGQVTFKNGTKFRWSIINDGQDRPNFSRVGTADNSFVAFNLYKDTHAVLYEVDGWKCQAIYWGY
ncbi:hypothetical protein VTL71DRAFT_10422 [Oculimacula yallundae]|uniref:Uncharacterized protein n=1 Tax=Oculimacula yallundae TaxID=86028 RepID=A0ABR4CSY9_9HELO